MLLAMKTGDNMAFCMLFILVSAVIGLTNILVDPATIAVKLRNFLRILPEKIDKKEPIFPNLLAFWQKVWAGDYAVRNIFSWFFRKVNQAIGCYQCCGFWVGIFCGFVLFSQNFLVCLMCGFAGSFWANMNALVMNYIQARTIVDFTEDDK